MAIEIFSGKFLRLVLEEDSSGKTREKVYLKDAIVIVPIVEAKKLIFVKEKRWEAGGVGKLKLITGYVEENENPYKLHKENWPRKSVALLQTGNRFSR